MNNTLIAGLIIGAIVILGGIAFMVYGTPTGSPSTTATTTTDVGASGVDTSGTVTTNTTKTTTTTAASPTVTTSTLVIVSNANAIVTGKVTPNGSATSYWYDYGRTSALDQKTGVQSIGSGNVSIAAPVIINGLAQN